MSFFNQKASVTFWQLFKMLVTAPHQTLGTFSGGTPGPPAPPHSPLPGRWQHTAFRGTAANESINRGIRGSND